MEKLIQEWLDAKKKVLKAVDAMDRALKRAEKLKAPKNLRPATAKDIKVNSIIWYPGDTQEFADRDYWKRVERVLYPDDNWKAYVAHDGNRHGLWGAYVKTTSKKTSIKQK